MAETSTPKPAMASANNNPARERRPYEIYVQPAPIKTFPLPSFYPSNPLSFIQLAYAWFGQILFPPAAEPSIIHQGTWSVATTSVHIKDAQSMRALWEQGFYGKGNLSRSEPNWLKREEVRRGLQEGHVSEIHTVERREERIRAKWERARLEQENIRQTREREARQAEKRRAAGDADTPLKAHIPAELLAPVGPAEILALPNSAASLPGNLVNGFVKDEPSHGESSDDYSKTNGTLDSSLETSDDTSSTEGPISTPVIPGLDRLKRRKSVRFSPTVASTTFDHADPPSPGHSTNPKQNESLSPGPQAGAGVLINKEHLQLMPEEALWLNFAIGALVVLNDSGDPLSTRELLNLFRQHSVFPPLTGPDDPSPLPDDDFLLHYVVYHHFRSLGWVPRAGIKFGVDWLLYNRGPVFDHAEFGLLVIPSYSDPWWQSSGKRKPQKTWQWFHSILRVLSHVMKSMVLVYVDVPPPHKFEHALESGLADALRLYKVREIMVKRWSSNRNR
ncbi:unnamed protein product [Clonostachys rhizophaga]|uniref:tRNA-intron lyase n=1 Tax=Clonostachys rhizophaga TaxID=160324 RepID=A0A9N9VBZ2_9HYPO|nr:unnamed protein product [Clonostachys rhizophaga]